MTSVVYKIFCKDENIKECYVGSTRNIRKRIYEHKRNCNNKNRKKYNFPVYKFIREYGGWGNWQFSILEEVGDCDDTELRQRERFWYDELKSTLNDKKPFSTREEYREEHKEELSQKHKEWYKENKEEISQRMREYYEENKEKILEYKKEYHQKNKEKIAQKTKEYREENKEKIAQKNKKYREENKEKISEKQKEKITCPCGSVVRKQHIRRHERTTKHQEWLELYQFIVEL